LIYRQDITVTLSILDLPPKYNSEEGTAEYLNIPHFT